MSPLKDPDAAIRYAIDHPKGCDPLHAQLWPGMKVVIAMDDNSMPLPPMRRPDIRERILRVVLEVLAENGVDDIEIIIATCLHRKLLAEEIRGMVGDRVFDAYWPDRLYNHDAEEPGGMKYVGETALGERVVLNRRAVEADLIIYANLNFAALDGGHKSVAVGLCGYESLKAHHNPAVLRESRSFMDPASSRLHTVIDRMGQVATQSLRVFTIETTVNNQMFDHALRFLAKNEDDFTAAERIGARTLAFGLDRLPLPAAMSAFKKFVAPYGMIGVNAGATEAVHPLTLERIYEQVLVPVQGQADILVFGLTYLGPYNVGAFLNPLLVQVMSMGYLFNTYKGHPLVKKGGTMIFTHPCTDRFDAYHAPYVEFVHRLLPETRDAMTLHRRYEEAFANDPTYIELYRNAHAFHPAHAFYMWYWGEHARQHLGRVIVVGADNAYIPAIFGWETARSMTEAIEMARDTAPPSPQITLLHLPPLLQPDVTL